MSINQLKKNKNQNKIIFLTTNNSSPIKIRRINFSNSQNFNLNKPKYRNENIFNNSSNTSLNNTQKYIFNCYKISPIIALSIYEKAINKLLEYIKKLLSKKNYCEIKRKYISYVIDELHIKSKNDLINMTDQDLMNVNIKLFTSNNDNSQNNSNKNFVNYNKLNINSNILYRTNCNSNSLFKLNKSNSKKNKLLSFKSFNNLEFKKPNNSLMNSSNALVQAKNTKNICQTEYNQNNRSKSKNINNNGSKKKLKKNKKKEKNSIKEHLTKLRNISMMNGSPYSVPLKNIFCDNKKKLNEKERNSNKDNKIPNKNKNNNNKTIEENKQIQNKEKVINNNKNNGDIKDNEKICVHQLNLIKENLEDNLKNMFNFSYGYFLNNERESDSSKSLHDLYKFSNKLY